MSYASRLLAMSRDRVPTASPRPVEEAASPEEALVEVAPPPSRAPSAAPAPAASPRMTPVAASSISATSPRPPVRQEAPPQERASAKAPEPSTHHTVERHTTIEAAPPARRSSPAATPLVPAPALASRAVLSPQAQWLAEDVRAPDPLVESADTDALRDLMRSVRQWTSSPPTVVEPAIEEHAASPAAPVVGDAAQSNHVSIGNVTITVEDAPASRAARTPTPARTTSDRMARHLIREP